MSHLTTLILPATLMLLPGIALAQTVVTDLQEHAISTQSVAVGKQQLTVLNNIQALLQVLMSRPQALAALAYARQQTEAQHAELATSK